MENLADTSLAPCTSQTSFTSTVSADSPPRSTLNMSHSAFEDDGGVNLATAEPATVDHSSRFVLGQLSYAPATQTTVVTTTTTTTTKFPPLIMKAPRHLHDLDPKVYPLADSPTPASIKKFRFNAGSHSALFREASDTDEALREVNPPKHLRQHILTTTSTKIRGRL